MTAESGDPHTIGKALAGEDEYQAPPREESDSQAEADDGALERLEDQAAEEPVDINLLEAQQQPEISPIPVAPADKKNIVVSGPDERTQPGGPQVPPPGESM